MCRFLPEVKVEKAIIEVFALFDIIWSWTLEALLRKQQCDCVHLIKV